MKTQLGTDLVKFLYISCLVLACGACAAGDRLLPSGILGPIRLLTQP